MGSIIGRSPRLFGKAPLALCEYGPFIALLTSRVLVFSALCSYRRNEKFTWHLDALAPSDDLESLGGQRTATLLVYLTDLSNSDGGATMFRDLKGADGTLRV
jgi:hypothetical protein